MDAATLASLKKVPAVDSALKLLFRTVHEKRTRLSYLSSTVRVSPRQFSYIHELLAEAVEILDMETTPELFITQTPIANAFAYGMDNPFVVLNSALLELLTPEELQVVIAHELGHILAGHMLYQSVLYALLGIMQMGGLGIPFGQLGLRAFLVARLFEWSRPPQVRR